jgi:crotonobetainyl-CoA:carnitine CoA-transferase CaiB-like acyl-CoA transferase
MVRSIEHTRGGEVGVLGNPIKMSRSPDAPFTSPPLFGEHTDAILRDIGCADDEIAHWRQQGLVA